MIICPDCKIPVNTFRVSVTLDGVANATDDGNGKIKWDIDEYTEVSDIIEVSCPYCFNSFDDIITMDDLKDAVLNRMDIEEIRKVIFRRDEEE